MSAPAGSSIAPEVIEVGTTLVEVSTEEQIRALFPVMVQLRPHLIEDRFVEQVERMRKGGYRILAATEEGQVRALAGYRVGEMLAYGRFLYVDDLISDETERSRGFGALLFDRLKSIARDEDCVALHLDSGVQRARAHRFYFREGMHIPSYHFAMPLRTALPGTNRARDDSPKTTRRG